jgi:hypothetical protein
MGGQVSALSPEDLEELQSESGCRPLMSYFTLQFLRGPSRNSTNGSRDWTRTVAASSPPPTSPPSLRCPYPPAARLNQQFSVNLLSSRIAALFSHLNFRQFIQLLAPFNIEVPISPERSKQNRDSPPPTLPPHPRVLFKLFDVDDDGFVGEGDVKAILLLLVGKANPFSDDQISHTARKTIIEFDDDGDGKLDRKEFDCVRVK